MRKLIALSFGILLIFTIVRCAEEGAAGADSGTIDEQRSMGALEGNSFALISNETLRPQAEGDVRGIQAGQGEDSTVRMPVFTLGTTTEPGVDASTATTYTVTDDPGSLTDGNNPGSLTGNGDATWFDDCFVVGTQTGGDEGVADTFEAILLNSELYIGSDQDGSNTHSVIGMPGIACPDGAGSTNYQFIRWGNNMDFTTTIWRSTTFGRVALGILDVNSDSLLFDTPVGYNLIDDSQDEILPLTLAAYECTGGGTDMANLFPANKDGHTNGDAAFGVVDSGQGHGVFYVDTSIGALEDKGEVWLGLVEGTPDLPSDATRTCFCGYVADTISGAASTGVLGPFEGTAKHHTLAAVEIETVSDAITEVRGTFIDPQTDRPKFADTNSNTFSIGSISQSDGQKRFTGKITDTGTLFPTQGEDIICQGSVGLHSSFNTTRSIFNCLTYTTSTGSVEEIVFSFFERDGACAEVAICGEDNVTIDEECDDGNLQSDDGCSNVCETDVALGGTFVLGQPDTETRLFFNGSDGFKHMGRVTDVWNDGTKLYVTDRSAHRLMIWNTIPTTTFEAADVILGQADEISHVANAGGRTGATMNFPDAVHVSGGKLYVADRNNHRILVWDDIPTVTGTAADFAIGQPDLTSGTGNNGGRSASSLQSPNGIVITGTKLIVSERGNDRILIWNTVPTTFGVAADVVLGQANFGVRSISPVTASTLNNPRGLTVVGTKLIVADEVNHRVLIWNDLTTISSTDPADVVLGQADFTSNGVNAGAGLGSPEDDTFDNPQDVYSDGTKLYVADDDNNRILIWDTIPTIDQTPADAVFGQTLFTTSGGGVSATELAQPVGVWSDGTDMWITDNSNFRVLIPAVP